MLKISQLFKKFTNRRASKSRIYRIKNAKFSGYCFICTQTYKEIFKSALHSVPLIILCSKTWKKIEYQHSLLAQNVYERCMRLICQSLFIWPYFYEHRKICNAMLTSDCNRVIPVELYRYLILLYYS